MDESTGTSGDASKAEHEEAEAVKGTERAMVGLTGQLVWWTRAMAFAAVVAVCVSALQWCSMRDQIQLVRDSGADTRAAIAAANRQADLAVDANAGAQSIAADQRRRTDDALGVSHGQLITAQDTAKRQLRAYVTSDGVQLFTPGKGDAAIWRLIPYAKNAGTTPTRDMHIQIHCGIKGIPEMHDGTPVNRDIGPGQSVGLGSCNHTTAQIEKFEAANIPSLVFVKANYRDIFGNLTFLKCAKRSLS
jgi:hypothetical protein